MSNIKVLDCTLRDGGYINNWNFGQQNIKGIIENLTRAKIDIIECGFIRNTEQNVDSSLFSSMLDFEKIIAPKCKKVLYAIMIEHHNYAYNLIPDYNEKGADIIRVTFHINEWQEAKIKIKELIDKGYKVCIQPVGTTNYDDESLITLLKDVNELKVYAFYLVDTLGVMYRHDMRRFFYLIDNNLSSNIHIGFHSHNNLQMSFANAQEMMRLAYKRNIIIDSSCYGMGRGVGNLPTELLVDYVNNNVGSRYSLIPILNTIDKYLMPIFAEHKWGYDLPFFLAATSKCHPNYAAYLMRKETLDIESIEKLLSLIPQKERGEFNENLVEKIYVDFQSSDIDDTLSIEKLKEIIADREVIILGSGASILEERKKITSYGSGRFLITVNFITELYTADALFVSNKKRFNREKDKISGLVLSTSNLSISNSLVFNYSSLLGEGAAADNAGAMLVRILKTINVKKIFLAGFDGFDVDSSRNFIVNDFRKAFEHDFAEQKNEEISRQLKSALDGINYEVLTKTKYDI